MQSAAELAALRFSSLGRGASGWLHGVGRLRRRRRIVAPLGRRSLLWAADICGGVLKVSSRHEVAGAPRYSLARVLTGWG